MIPGVPLFRGRDNNDQLNAIIKVVGTPSDDVLRRIAAESPEIQLRNFPRYPKVPWHTLYPKAHPLGECLVFCCCCLSR